MFFPEMFVSTYESTQRHNPEDHRHLYHRENLKSNLEYVIHRPKEAVKRFINDRGLKELVLLVSQKISM
jgi:hypothetical protein